MGSQHFWRNIFQGGGLAPVATAGTLVSSVVTSVTNPPPTLGSEGFPLPKSGKRILLTYVTAGVAGEVPFRVWHYLSSCGWFLEDAIGAAGTVTVAATTDPQRAVILEYPGERIYIEVMSVAVSTLTIYAFESISGE